MKFFKLPSVRKNFSGMVPDGKFFSSARVITPLRYFGQRELIVDDLFNVLKIKKAANFYDPFSGSGSISFAAMDQKKADNFYINDSLPVLKDLWEWVRKDPKSLVELYCESVENYYKSPLNQRGEVYNKFLEQFKSQRKMVDKPNLAALFAFLINFSEKNIPIFSQNFELSTKPDLNIDRESKYADMQLFNERVNYLSTLFQENKVVFSSGDYLKCVKNAEKGDVIIFDPPYPQQSHDIYYNLKNETDLRKNLSQTFTELARREVDFIVLYGAGDIPSSAQFSELGLQHLIRLSFHPHYGEFLEHLYVSPSVSLHASALPTGIVFHDQLFYPDKSKVPVNYNQALSHLQLARKSGQEKSVPDEESRFSPR